MRRLQQSTSRVVMLKVFLSSDHVSAATGKTVAITISKNGGAFANPNAGATNATEVSSGWYKVTLDTTDTNTVGDLVVRGTATACDDSEQICQVQSGIEQTGDSYARLGAPAGASVSADILTIDDFLDTEVAAIKAKTDSLTFTVANKVDANIRSVNSVTVNGDGAGTPWGP